MFTHARTFAAVLAAVAPILFAAGCKTTGTERAAKAADSLESLQAEIQKAGDLLAASVTALTDLTKNPQSDLKPQYDTFTKSMDALEAQIAVAKSRAEAMKARGKEYFTAWEETSKGMSSSEMKEYFESRRAQLNETYEKIKAETARVGDVGKSLMDSLRDVRKYLSMDLTANGITTAAPIAEKAQQSAAQLKTDVETLRGELENVAKLLSPPKAQPPK